MLAILIRSLTKTIDPTQTRPESFQDLRICRRPRPDRLAQVFLSRVRVSLIRGSRLHTTSTWRIMLCVHVYMPAMSKGRQSSFLGYPDTSSAARNFKNKDMAVLVRGLMIQELAIL
jgi:hypothetical protein